MKITSQLWEITFNIPGRGDFPACPPAEAAVTQFSNPTGMQGRVDLDGGYIPR